MRARSTMPTRRQLLPLLALGVVAVPALARAPLAYAQDESPENLFISPPGQPFRAPPDAPYPVATWFVQVDKNGDGKLDHGEFLADAEAFFKVLDRRGRGVLGPFDVQYYEHVIAPEVLGPRTDALAAPPARLWLTQHSNGPGAPASTPLEPGLSDDRPTPDTRKPRPPTLDESRQGASPYSFFDEPEPVTAADLEYTGYISKANFLKLAEAHFASLDRAGAGYLTLAGLPKTLAQRLLEARRPRRGS